MPSYLEEMSVVKNIVVQTLKVVHATFRNNWTKDFRDTVLANKSYLAWLKTNNKILACVEGYVSKVLPTFFYKFFNLHFIPTS